METKQRKPLVAIVGRPNVGKSTLFNRLIGTNRAITSDQAGTTRDRIYGDAEWQDKVMTLVDTGGLIDETPETTKEIQQAVNGQVKEAIEESDLVLFVVDVTEGITAADRTVADMLRKSGKEVLVVANKADSKPREERASEFWEFGLPEVLPVSAQHARGTGDLLDALWETFKDFEATEEPISEIPKVALIGRSNVGKSTLFNHLAHDERAITSDSMHTTRDVSSVMVETPAGSLQLLDTAGMQRRGKSGKGIAKYSLLRTLRAINDADVVVLMLDAEEGPTVQDAHITSYVLEAGKSIVLAVNKWDLIEKTPDIQDRFMGKMQDILGFLPSPPVVFLSAKTGEKVDNLARGIYDVYNVAATEVETSELNQLLRSNLDRLPAGGGKGPAKLYYATQVGTRPPTFLLFVNKTEAWKDNHRRFLQNLLHREYELIGTPVKLKFRAKKPREVMN